ncbi:Metallo-dependent phosphatase-like protein [Aspergillus lucknowensis]|uniref:Metallo-dependent phosphatase-like protein n=1 Tax=Aspergillus lucknowensis TaxID=176173 RepID=A0ABR4LNW7_9EURO
MFEKLHSILHKQSTSFQVLSDLHLEINQQYLSYEIPLRSKHLILAGDVGRLVDYDNYRSFLQKQTDRFELVFLVLGNHEFYNDTFAAGLQRARQLEQEPSLNGRLILLHRGRYDIPSSGVTILGCTLWSKVPGEAVDIVRLIIQDFKQIQDWIVDDHSRSHEADLSWLLGEIESIRSGRGDAAQSTSTKRSIVVVTHHAPSLRRTSSPQHANNPWSSAFGTDVLPQLSKSSGVKVWVFGHTHYTTEFKNRGIRVTANQRGYVLSGNSGEPKDGFDVGKVIHV